MASSEKSKKKKKRTFKDCTRLFLFVPCCLLIIGAACTAIGNYWVQIAEKYREKELLEEKMLSLREKEEELKVDVEKLKDPDYIARYAREKYMYSKDGEIILRIPEED